MIYLLIYIELTVFNWLFDSKRTTVHFRTPLCFAIFLIISLLSFWHARCVSIVASGQRRKMKKRFRMLQPFETLDPSNKQKNKKQNVEQIKNIQL